MGKVTIHAGNAGRVHDPAIEERHMGTPLRIALLTDGVVPHVVGGMQRHSRMLMEHLARLGTEVIIFHTVRDARKAAGAERLPDELPPDLRGKVQCQFVPYPPMRRFPGHYLAEEAEYSRRLLARYIEAGCRAHFIYAQGLTSLAFLRHRDSGGRLPAIGVNTHGYEMFQRADGLRTKLQHLLLRPAFTRVNRGADRVFCFSGKIRSIARRIGVPESRIVDMPNGIDPNWIAAGPSRTGQKRRFTFIGRHERRKGVPELVQAILQLGAGPWEVRFIGPIPESLQLRLPGVSYLGSVTDNAKLMASLDDSDCLVCPSFAEGMPTVILEAMARGNVIIATDVGATRELVDSGNGILLDFPRVRDIGDAMRTIIGMDDARLDSLKRSSLDRVVGYGWPMVARKHVEAIESCIACLKHGADRC